MLSIRSRRRLISILKLSLDWSSFAANLSERPRRVIAAMVMRLLVIAGISPSTAESIAERMKSAIETESADTAAIMNESSRRAGKCFLSRAKI